MLKSVKKAYFLGIGGIGMSAIARYFNAQGIAVYGYDKTPSPLTKKLEEEGMKIHFEEDIEAIPAGIDIVVWTPAIPLEHKELNYFLANNFPVKKRAEVLGMISREKRTIAIAGTHGKTTTTSILTHVLKTGGVDCNAFLGGIAMNFDNNFVAGASDWVVVEADEYDRSFLQLTPEIAAITSVDADHLDIYGDHETMLKEGFEQFISQVKGNVYVAESTARIANTTYIYGEKGDFAAKNIRVESGYFHFDFKSEIENIKDLKFTLPGRHNIENATAAIAIAQELGVKGEAIREALQTFKGIKRRFEFLHRSEKHVYIDDYAHHPSELRAAIGAARELFPNRKLTGIFQPHLFSRTQDFQDGFAEELSKLDEVILLDIYPARELPIEGVNSALILSKISNKNKRLVQKEALLNSLNINDLDVLMTLGAGDIDRFREPIKNLFK